MKKLLVLVLTVIILAFSSFTLSGCSHDIVVKPDEYVDGKLEITYFSWDIGGMDTTKMSDVPVLDYIQNKLGIKIKPITSGWNGWENTLNTNIGAGEIPDVFIHWGFDRTVQLEKWIKNQVMAEINPDENELPHLAAQMKKYKQTQYLSAQKPYCLPIAWKLDEPANKPMVQHGLVIRKDWIANLEAKGVDIFYPKTESDLDKWDMQAFDKLIDAFANNDPNNSGKKDTYGIGLPNDGRTFWWYPILNMFGASEGKWEEKDGKYVPDLTSDNMKEAVAYLGKLIDNKIMDPSYATTDIYKYKEKFVTGSVGIIPYNAGVPFYDDIYTAFESIYGDAASEKFAYMPVPKGKNGESYIQAYANYWSQTSISSRITDNKKHKIMQLLDLLISNEGRDLLKFGIEGTHYRRDGDKIINLIPNKGNGKENNINSIDMSVEALKKLVTWERFEEDKNVPAINNRAEQIQSAKYFRDAAKLSKTIYVKVSPKKFDYVQLKNLDDVYIKGMCDSLALFKRRGVDDKRTYVQKLEEFNGTWSTWTTKWLNQGNGGKYIDEFNNRINEMKQQNIFEIIN